MNVEGSKDAIILKLMKTLNDGVRYVCEVSEKRSNTANAYYWALINQYARWTHKSAIYWHNDILERFGVDDEIDGQAIYVIIPDNIRYKELTYIHLRQTTQTRVGKGGVLYRTYVKLRDSHTLGSWDFSRLIDGLIEEIQGSDAPIETMTPAELARLVGYEK